MKPDHAIEVGQPCLLPLIGNLHGFPTLEIKVRTRHFANEFSVGLGIDELLPTFQDRFVLLRNVLGEGLWIVEIVLDFGNALGHAWQLRDLLLARPGLDNRATPGGVD